MTFFHLSEFIRSATADRQQIDNTPDFTEVENLKRLVDNVLDPLRAQWGKPIIVTSGFRCLALNRAIGGAVSSQHILGQAADIVPQGRKPEDVRRLFKLIQDMKLPFDQLINEQHYSWIHVSYSPRHRRQVLQKP